MKEAGQLLQQASKQDKGAKAGAGVRARLRAAAAAAAPQPSVNEARRREGTAAERVGEAQGARTALTKRGQRSSRYEVHGTCVGLGPACCLPKWGGKEVSYWMKRKSPTMEISEGEDAGPSEASPTAAAAARRRDHGAEAAAGGGGGDADNPEWVGAGSGGGGGDTSSNPSEAPPAWEGGGRGAGGKGRGGGGGSRGYRSKGGDDRSPPAAHRNFYDG